MILKGKDNVYQQIINEYKRYITLNIIKKDEKLPSCRSLATSLGINPNTVQKAYNVLENEGYIKVLPKKGVYVIYDNKESKNEEIKEELTKFKETVSYEDLIKLVNEVYGRDQNDRN